MKDIVMRENGKDAEGGKSHQALTQPAVLCFMCLLSIQPPTGWLPLKPAGASMTFQTELLLCLLVSQRVWITSAQVARHPAVVGVGFTVLIGEDEAV